MSDLRKIVLLSVGMTAGVFVMQKLSPMRSYKDFSIEDLENEIQIKKISILNENKESVYSSISKQSEDRVFNNQKIPELKNINNQIISVSKSNDFNQPYVKSLSSPYSSLK